MEGSWKIRFMGRCPCSANKEIQDLMRKLENKVQACPLYVETETGL
jgi:hypothetical protein